MDSAFRALADPTRRDILRLLRDGPRTSGEIAQHFDAAWPTVSRHLAVLREALSNVLRHARARTVSVDQAVRPVPR